MSGGGSGGIAGLALAGGVVLAIVGQLNGWWCGKECMDDAAAARKARLEIIHQPPPAVRPPPAVVPGAVEVAGHQERRHGHSGHRQGGHTPSHTCPSGTRYDAQARLCKSPPYTVERPRPSGDGWTRYNHGPLESGWVRQKCVANC